VRGSRGWQRQATGRNGCGLFFRGISAIGQRSNKFAKHTMLSVVHIVRSLPKIATAPGRHLALRAITFENS
jgi:hypothetical protein